MKDDKEIGSKQELASDSVILSCFVALVHAAQTLNCYTV